MTTPSVTLILPTFNGEQYIEQALNSLLNQTYSNLKILILDDNSSDETFYICKRKTDSDGRVKLIKNETNLGGVKNFLKGLHLSETDYVCWVSQDDYWDKNFVSVLVKKLVANPDASVAGCATSLIDLENNQTSILFLKRDNFENISTFEATARLLLRPFWRKHNFILHGIIDRKKLLDAFNVYGDFLYHDRHILLLLMLRGRVLISNELLFFRRAEVGLKLRQKHSADEHNYRVRMYGSMGVFFKTLIPSIMKSSSASIILRLYCVMIVLLYSVDLSYTKYRLKQRKHI